MTSAAWLNMGLRERLFPKRKIVLDFTGPFRTRFEILDHKNADPTDIHFVVPDDAAVRIISFNACMDTGVAIGTRVITFNATRGDQIIGHFGRSETIANNTSFNISLSDAGASPQSPLRQETVLMKTPSNLYLFPRDILHMHTFLGSAVDALSSLTVYYQAWEFD